MDQVLFPQQSSGRGSARILKFARKLMWASCLCTIVISLQFLTQPADALPVLVSSRSPCMKVQTKAGPLLDCCLPNSGSKWKTPKRFQFPKNRKMRERKPAHVLSKDLAYVKKYNEAYRRMKALPAGDPRSFDTQWKTHCSFCVNGFYPRTLDDVPLVGGINLQVHFSWLFLPWHRMLLYFHERTLGKLINDDTFALPFWNWDNQMDYGANQMPSFLLPGFPIDNSALLNANRNYTHFPPQILPLNYKAADPPGNKTDEEIIEENLVTIYTQVVDKVGSRDFMGGPYRIQRNSSGHLSVEFDRLSGGVESLHNVAHSWVGLINGLDNEDMGTFIYAGRETIFYTHHGNVDRLWDVWRTLPDTVTVSGTRKRQEHQDPDFLDSEMTFYDENGETVIVKVKDTFNSAKLGYKYTKMTLSDRLWIEHQPQPPVPPSRVTDETWEPTGYSEVDPNANNTISDTPISFNISRRAPNATDLIGKEVTQIDQLIEEVVIEDVKVPVASYVRLDAFLDLASANRSTDVDQSGYLGTFIHLANGQAQNTSSGVVEEDQVYETFNIPFSTSKSLARLGITDYNTTITITIVPSMVNTTLTFETIRQDFQ